MNLKNILLVIPALTILAACGDSNQGKPVDDTTAIPVKVSPMSPSKSGATLYASGTIEAVQSANISTRIMGFVQRLRVKPGDKVRKGTVLIEINNADIAAKRAQIRANILAAEAAFANVEKDYGRYKALFEAQSASQKEMDDISAQYQMAKAKLEAARQMEQEVEAQMNYVRIKSPFNGVVTNTFVKEGDLANPGMPLLEVESPDQFQVVAMVPESDISKITQDMAVNVHLKTLDQWLSGKVSEVSSSSKNTGGQYLVKVILEDTPQPVKSGMYATVGFQIEGAGQKDALLIPSDILVNRGQLTGVYTVSAQDKALLRWIRLGRAVGDSVTVLSGLNAEDRVIISAEGKLYNGAKIQVQ
ncbi:MAG: efflux RND transporter periplasmic adaptor subunit [Eudoraea sp.]|nr:efflux RND transporter periplasmic adaptor subunit [Eudoraea sp.]